MSMKSFVIILSLLQKIIIFGCLTLILMLLWNYLIVDLFNQTVINYWQSMGLYIITNILFKSSILNFKLANKS